MTSSEDNALECTYSAIKHSHAHRKWSGNVGPKELEKAKKRKKATRLWILQQIVSQNAWEVLLLSP
jgi:hypothetical protein